MQKIQIISYIDEGLICFRGFRQTPVLKTLVSQPAESFTFLSKDMLCVNKDECLDKLYMCIAEKAGLLPRPILESLPLVLPDAKAIVFTERASNTLGVLLERNAVSNETLCRHDVQIMPTIGSAKELYVPCLLLNSKVVASVSDYLDYIKASLKKRNVAYKNKVIEDFASEMLKNTAIKGEIAKIRDNFLKLADEYLFRDGVSDEIKPIAMKAYASLCLLYEAKGMAIPSSLYNFEREDLTFYRGVTSPRFPEIPSILRRQSNLASIECDCYREYVLRFPHRFLGKTPIEILTDMQHFELPTRMLDVTTNPLVALYMACCHQYSSPDSLSYPGEIISYFPHRNGEVDELKYFDSIRVQVLASLPTLSHFEKSEIKRGLSFLKTCSNPEEWTRYFKGLSPEPPDSQYSSPAATRRALACLERIVKERIPAFVLAKYDINDLLLAHYVRTGLINERIKAQSGSFILFGLNERYADDYFISSRKNSYGILRCIVVNKPHILRELKILGISQETLFPGLTSSAKVIKESVAP